MKTKNCDFAGMPAVPENDINIVESRFSNYLFFETVKKGVRKYTCSHCGESFERGTAVQLRIEGPEDRELAVGKLGDKVHCPLCGASATIKYAKHCDFTKLYEDKYVLFYIAATENELWFRGCNFYKIFRDGVLAPEIKSYEIYRYKLTPGNAEMWKKYGYNSEFYKEDIITDAFIWNHDIYCKKYDYSMHFTENSLLLDETFLKYSSFETYCQSVYYDPPLMKYLALYACHPQVEMLVKFGHSNVVEMMMSKNTDYVKFVNWSAKNPWELFNLSHSEYNEWGKYYYDFELLKLYKRLKDFSPRGFEHANEVLEFFKRNYSYMQKIITLNVIARVEGKTAYDAVKYFKKISRDSGYGCHNAPTAHSPQDVYEMWVDYRDMVLALPDGFENRPVFPHDLKIKHDKAIAARNAQIAKENKKQMAADIVRYNKSAVAQFPKVEKILAEIKEKYEYIGEKYSVIVPKNIKEIVTESIALDLCVHTAPTGRYYDRISRRETYILFLRENAKPKSHFYLLEAEPNGTLRQKRTLGDTQIDSQVKDFMPFIKEWQAEVQKRLSENDKKLAARSKELRIEGFEDLKKTKKTINYGEKRGKLLVEVLEADLLEVIA